ncbi:hypothetical protein F4810DRAFT_711323 [Camillea tinctor]|nr:hypothetical protein F4810DRAFT_711323 [Camillea tinctor]
MRTRTDGNQRGPVETPSYPQAQGGPSSKAGKTIRKPWADEPWPLIETPSKTQNITHPALHIANEMAHTHNAMLRGLNAIYLQAPHVTAADDDVADLLFLARAWSAWALDHHVLKQTAMLPGFEAVLDLEPGALGGGRRDEGEEGRDGEQGPEEDILTTALRHVHAYACTTTSSTYDPHALRALLARLGALLEPHLRAQISVLSGMRELCFCPPPPSRSHPPPSSSQAEHRANALLRIHAECIALANDSLDRPVAAPLILGLRDASYEGGRGADWPRLSVPAVHAVADRLAPRHAGAWRFLPCDVWGRARGLRGV